MKIQREEYYRAKDRGSATIVFISLLAIMLILVTANSKSLLFLHREVKLLEQNQIKRLDHSQTNAVIAAGSTALPETK
jgi:hypothetical protein